VETAKNPSLRGLPVVTGADRGIVTAASYEAKALGILRGMPIFRVKKEFPSVRVLFGDYPAYVEYSGRVFDIVRRYADDVEEYSIDECFADLTGLDRPLRMSYKEIAERVQQEIWKELNLSVSIGVAPTKVLAKAASKWIKPGGLTVIDPVADPTFYQHVLRTTPVDKVWGIGRQTSHFLRKKNIVTAEDFANQERAWMKEHFSKPYGIIWYELNGASVLAVDPVPKTLYSSIQKTKTFHPPSSDANFLLSQISKHIEEACAKARHYGLTAGKMSMFLKTRNFRYAFCPVPFAVSTNSPEILMSHARREFPHIYNAGTLYRTAGVVLRDLVPMTAAQKDLFGGSAKADKFEAVHRQIDSLEYKLGKRVVHLASTHEALKGERVEELDLDRDLLFL